MNLRYLLPFAIIGGCSGGAPDNAVTAESESVTVPAAPTAKAFKDEGKNDLLEWSLSYPGEIAAIPVLAESIRADFDKAKRESLATAKADKAERGKSGFPFNAYDLTNAYETAGNTPALFSVSEDWMTFTGGAHPNHGTSALLWDRAAGKEVAFDSLIEGGAATLASLYRETYCKALDAARAKKREGADLPTGADDPFSQCPKFSELAIIPKGPAAGGPMTVILFHADPYVAGPYVEGDYDIELPVTEGLVAALKPPYRASFAAKP